MPRSVANAERVTVDPSLTPDYLPGMIGETPRREQVSAGKSVTAIDLCGLLADSIDATGSRKEAATDMGISAPVLTKQLARTDDAAPRLDRMSQLKPETLAEFGRRIVATCGVADPVLQAHKGIQDAMQGLASAVDALGRVNR